MKGLDAQVEGTELVDGTAAQRASARKRIQVRRERPIREGLL